MRNFNMFIDVIAPAVYERVSWSFFGDRVAPALLAITNSLEGLQLVSSVCEEFFRISPQAPIYGNQLSMSRHETLSALEQTVQICKVRMKDHPNDMSALTQTTLVLNKFLREACNLSGVAITASTTTDAANLKAAEAFINMNM
jgi:hypothetical protein